MTRVALLASPRDVARAVLAGQGIEAALGRHALLRGDGWPHADSADALRGLADHGTGEGCFLVVRREQDGREVVVGDCGWCGPPGGDGVVEIGYGLAPPARRQGLGTEAVQLLLHWVREQPGVREVTAEVLVGNEPSLRLLARVGLSVVGRTGDHVVLSDR